MKRIEWLWNESLRVGTLYAAVETLLNYAQSVTRIEFDLNWIEWIVFDWRAKGMRKNFCGMPECLSVESPPNSESGASYL